jgi:hypothetical protein
MRRVLIGLLLIAVLAVVAFCGPDPVPWQDAVRPAQR